MANPPFLLLFHDVAPLADVDEVAKVLDARVDVFLKSKANTELATNYTIRIVYFGGNSTKVKESVDQNT